MAEHKVPQDVEADDKLIGPFSFRQFIYLMIAFGGCVAGFFLSQASPVLAIIPAPVVLLFGALALPLRKDQPMEVYLAALVKYYFGGSRTRIWVADGEEPNVTISAPETIDSPKTKDLAADEVSRRLSYLANLTDTQGWSTRGLSANANQTNLNDDYADAAQDAYDVMDDSNNVQVDNMLTKSAQETRNRAMAQLQAASPAAMPTPMPQAPNYATQSLQSAPLPNYTYQNASTPQTLSPSYGYDYTQPIAANGYAASPQMYTTPTTNSSLSPASSDSSDNVITNELLQKVAMHHDDMPIDRNHRVIDPNGNAQASLAGEAPSVFSTATNTAPAEPVVDEPIPVADNKEDNANDLESVIMDTEKDKPKEQAISASDGSFIDIKFH